MGEMRKAIAIRPRTGRWWRARQGIFRRWRDSEVGAGKGWLMKTDLFDEASGEFHFAIDMPDDAVFLGLDIDEHVVGAAKASVQASMPKAGFIVADVRHLPLATGQIACTFSLSTLDHFDSEGEILISLKELWRTLEPGANLLLVLDNPANPEVALRGKLPEPIVRFLRADRFPLGVLIGQETGESMLLFTGFELLERGAIIHAPRYLAIRLMDVLDQLGMKVIGDVCERLVEWSELLGRLPTRYLTGHYLTWSAKRPSNPSK